MIHRSATFKVICTGIALVAYLIVSVQKEARRIDQLSLQPVNLEEVPDGAHQGGFVYQNQLSRVTVTTGGHRIQDIQVINHLSGEVYTQNANSVISQVLKAQTVNVPTDPNESLQQRAAKKALLFAIQGALKNTPLPSNEERSPRSTPSVLFLIAFSALCGSLGTQLAGYIAFRSGNLSSATKWVQLEDITFLAGVLAAAFALILTIM